MKRDNFNNRIYVVFSPLVLLFLNSLYNNWNYIIESMKKYGLLTSTMFVGISLINVCVMNNKLRKLEDDNILTKEEVRLNRIYLIRLEIDNIKVREEA